MNLDQVVLVDKQDREIGVMDKIEAHRGVGKLHRAISVFLFDSSGKLLVQQRSAEKIVGAGEWANTCCGNVRPKESYLECAQRRLREELGIRDVILKEITKFTYHTRCNDEFSEHEVDMVFGGRYDGEMSPNPEEVQSIKWITHESILKQAPLAPWVKIMGKQGIVHKVGEMYDQNWRRSMD